MAEEVEIGPSEMIVGNVSIGAAELMLPVSPDVGHGSLLVK